MSLIGSKSLSTFGGKNTSRQSITIKEDSPDSKAQLKSKSSKPIQAVTLLSVPDSTSNRNSNSRQESGGVTSPTNSARSRQKKIAPERPRAGTKIAQANLTTAEQLSSDFENRLMRVRKTWEQEELRAALAPSVDRQGQVFEFMDGLQEHVQTSYENMRQYLDRRYIVFLGALKRVHQNLNQYLGRLRSLENEMHTDTTMLRMEEDAHNFANFSALLEKDLQDLRAQIEAQHQTIEKLEVYRAEFAQRLESINKSNMALTTHITRLRKHLIIQQRQAQAQEQPHHSSQFSQGKSNLAFSFEDSLYRLELFCGSKKVPKNTQRGKLKKYFSEKRLESVNETQAVQANSLSLYAQPEEYASSVAESTELARLRAEAHTVQLRSQALRQKILEESNLFFERQNLFEETLACEQSYLEKLQKVVLRQDGLAGSLLFEMRKQKQQFDEQECYSFIRRQESLKHVPSALQDRQVTSLVYETLRHLWAKKFNQRHLKKSSGVPASHSMRPSEVTSAAANKEDDGGNELEQFDWKTFEKFTPMQIVGLIALKPKVFDDLRKMLSEKAHALRKAMQRNKFVAAGSILSHNTRGGSISHSRNSSLAAAASVQTAQLAAYSSVMANDSTYDNDQQQPLKNLLSASILAIPPSNTYQQHLKNSSDVATDLSTRHNSLPVHLIQKKN